MMSYALLIIHAIANAAIVLGYGLWSIFFPPVGIVSLAISFLVLAAIILAVNKMLSIAFVQQVTNARETWNVVTKLCIVLDAVFVCAPVVIL